MIFQSVDLFEKRTFEAEYVMIFSNRRFENIITYSASLNKNMYRYILQGHAPVRGCGSGSDRVARPSSAFLTSIPLLTA